ncbi:MAG TPA: hypothetical protein VK698_36245, partial [Kofleriaceae bacterium]|nr:hypothetical protein [Kofleriaceae bacterium]
MLGARPLQSADIVAVIAREAGAAGSFAAPWSAAGLAELTEVLGADPAADLSPLREVRFLLDHRGCARLPSEILRADGELRALLAPVRPLVADELAGPGSHRFLDGVGARVARTADLVGELVDGDRAAAVVAAAGSSRLIAHLAAAPPGELGDVQAARVVPGAGDTLAAIGEVWLTGEGPLADAVRRLASAPPLCDRQFEREHQAQLRRLGARSLGLPALVDLISRGELAVTAQEAGPFHAAIDAAAGELGPALSGRLAAAAIFPDEEGTMRALVGDRNAALIADDDEVRALWSGPWLRRDVASLAYVRRLGAEAIGPDAVARAVARGELGGQRRRPAFAYLTARGPRLSTERVDELAIAPIWPDAGGRLRPLAELRRDSEVPSVAELYRLWPRATTVEPDDLHGSAMALARAIGLEHVVVEPGLATAIEDLLAGSSAPPGAPFRGDPVALDLDARPDLAAAVIALLDDAAGELPRARLERALEAPIYSGTDGVRRRLGRWATPGPERCHRGADGLHRALAAGRYPVLDPGQERALAGFLDACGLRPATVIDLIGAVGVDGGVDEASAGAVRAALVAARDELAALEPRARSRLAQLSIWPTADGRQLPARSVLRGAELEPMLPATASEWRAAATWSALLSEAAEPDAARLAGVVEFADPIAALAAAVHALAVPGAPLTAQAPLLADPARVAEVAAVFFGARRAELPAEALPVGVDADGNLVARRLVAATPDEAELARGLSLRGQIAHPDWARRIDAAAPGALDRLTLRQLVAALQAGSPDPVIAADHPFLATPERRRILHAWLAARARDIAEDDQARGALGRAALMLSAGGWLRPPRDLLYDPDLPDLGIDWYPAAEVPLELRAWLRATYRPGGKQLAPLVEHLLAAGEAAIAAGDGARLADILEHMARSLGADLSRGGSARSPGDPTAGLDEELVDGARRFKLRRRLRVEDDGGRFARPRSLLALDPVGWDLVSRFAEPPPARVSPRYRDREPILRLCRAAGAAAELDESDLERALAGDRRPGIDSTIALSCYLALVATRRPDLGRRLRLDERAWVPDRSGTMRRAGELYWPDATLEGLIGLEDRLFPAPELAHRVPQARGWIGLRGPDQVALADVAAHMIELRAAGREVTDPVLGWLDDGLAAGRLGAGEVRDALDGCAFLRDDAGLPRLAEHLVLEGARPLFGDRRGDFPDGRRLPRLTAALRIARRPGKREVAGFLAEIADEVATGVDPLAADPAMADRLPRCLDVLVEAGGRGPSPLPIVCQGIDGYVVALLPDAAAAIDFDGEAPLSPVVPDAGDPEAWRSYLRAYGVGARRVEGTAPAKDAPLA